MTHAERNAVISRKIAVYTAKFTSSQAKAREALDREGLGRSSKTKSKTNEAA